MNCWLQNDGVLTVTYNMGKGVQTLNEPLYTVDDGRYHVVRFRRFGANATLQLDDNVPRAIKPKGIHGVSVRGRHYCYHIYGYCISTPCCG